MYCTTICVKIFRIFEIVVRRLSAIKCSISAFISYKISNIVRDFTISSSTTQVC